MSSSFPALTPPGDKPPSTFERHPFLVFHQGHGYRIKLKSTPRTGGERNQTYFDAELIATTEQEVKCKPEKKPEEPALIGGVYAIGVGHKDFKDKLATLGDLGIGAVLDVKLYPATKTKKGQKFIPYEVSLVASA